MKEASVVLRTSDRVFVRTETEKNYRSQIYVTWLECV